MGQKVAIFVFIWLSLLFTLPLLHNQVFAGCTMTNDWFACGGGVCPVGGSCSVSNSSVTIHDGCSAGESCNYSQTYQCGSPAEAKQMCSGTTSVCTGKCTLQPSAGCSGLSCPPAGTNLNHEWRDPLDLNGTPVCLLPENVGTEAMCKDIYNNPGSPPRAVHSDPTLQQYGDVAWGQCLWVPADGSCVPAGSCNEISNCADACNQPVYCNPTCTVSGPATATTGTPVTFTNTPANGATMIDLWTSPTSTNNASGPYGTVGSTTNTSLKLTNPVNTQLTFQNPGTYWVYCQGYNRVNSAASYGRCTGNPFGYPTGWSYCGLGSAKQITVSAPAPATCASNTISTNVPSPFQLGNTGTLTANFAASGGTLGTITWTRTSGTSADFTGGTTGSTVTIRASATTVGQTCFTASAPLSPGTNTCSNTVCVTVAAPTCTLTPPVLNPSDTFYTGQDRSISSVLTTNPLGQAATFSWTPTSGAAATITTPTTNPATIHANYAGSTAVTVTATLNVGGNTCTATTPVASPITVVNPTCTMTLSPTIPNPFYFNRKGSITANIVVTGPIQSRTVQWVSSNPGAITIDNPAADPTTIVSAVKVTSPQTAAVTATATLTPGGAQCSATTANIQVVPPPWWQVQGGDVYGTVVGSNISPSCSSNCYINLKN
ncbi:hypothetical protein M1403_00435 [Patescibacteria group bacterium]|nr:hypothetical protein [Patescibacteria group bacterium]